MSLNFLLNFLSQAPSATTRPLAATNSPTQQEETPRTLCRFPDDESDESSDFEIESPNKAQNEKKRLMLASYVEASSLSMRMFASDADEMPEARLDAELKQLCWYGLMHRVVNKAEELETLLQLHPESERLALLLKTNEDGQSVLQAALPHPSSLAVALSTLPLAARLQGVHNIINECDVNAYKIILNHLPITTATEQLLTPYLTKRSSQEIDALFIEVLHERQQRLQKKPKLNPAFFSFMNRPSYQQELGAIDALLKAAKSSHVAHEFYQLNTHYAGVLKYGELSQLLQFFMKIKTQLCSAPNQEEVMRPFLK